MKIKISILVILAGVCFTCTSQNAGNYTQSEIKCIDIFNGFIDYLKGEIKNKADIGDTAHLKYLLINFVFIDKKIDTTNSINLRPKELTNDEFSNLKRDVSSFYNFLGEMKNKSLLENIVAIPLRLSKDTFIYNRLTSFQKENTFIFYDNRYPDRTLGYILFVPPIKNLITKPKIWSWTLMFKFGKFFFRSVTGEEGHEYLFEK